jgi:hypothetical protein
MVVCINVESVAGYLRPSGITFRQERPESIRRISLPRKPTTHAHNGNWLLLVLHDTSELDKSLLGDCNQRWCLLEDLLWVTKEGSNRLSVKISRRLSANSAVYSKVNSKKSEASEETSLDRTCYRLVIQVRGSKFVSRGCRDGFGESVSV